MSLNWKTYSIGDDDAAKFEAAGLKVSVRDEDGDASYWCIYRGEILVASGHEHEDGEDPYHFDRALEAAESRFLTEFQRMKAIRRKKPNSPNTKGAG